MKEYIVLRSNTDDFLQDEVDELTKECNMKGIYISQYD